MRDLAEARRLALALPEVTQEPHFDMASFRVRGKIFVTVPPEETRLHVFVDPLEVEAYVAQDPAAFEPLLWGKQVRGVRVNLVATSAESLAEIIEESWRRKAPKGLVTAFDRRPKGSAAAAVFKRDRKLAEVRPRSRDVWLAFYLPRTVRDPRIARVLEPGSPRVVHVLLLRAPAEVLTARCGTGLPRRSCMRQILSPARSPPPLMAAPIVVARPETWPGIHAQCRRQIRYCFRSTPLSCS
jgi:hypothetical protein